MVSTDQHWPTLTSIVSKDYIALIGTDQHWPTLTCIFSKNYRVEWHGAVHVFIILNPRVFTPNNSWSLCFELAVEISFICHKNYINYETISNKFGRVISSHKL